MTTDYISNREPRRKRKPVSTRLRFRIFNRDGFRCRYCGATPDRTTLHVDHILAHSKGGDNSEDNLATSCAECNYGKSADDIDCLEDRFRGLLWKCMSPVRRGSGRDDSRLNLLDCFLNGESLKDLSDISKASRDDAEVNALLDWLSKKDCEE